MFIDEAKISVQAGDGGHGCFSYHRKRNKPRGKPDGGNGGRGGSVIVRCDPNINTLQDVSYMKSYKAGRGTHGQGSNKTGKSGEDIVVSVPPGTCIYNADTGDFLCDLTEKFQEEVVACGGRGGKGNASLVSRNNKDPEHAEKGFPGEKKNLRFVLKVLADIGLVGRPNAGKSTFLSVVSNARPEIADYPFTTKHPFLGIVQRKFNSFVIADIPGLIKDSHTGKGLGIRFLKHIERTRMIAVMVGAESENPAGDAEILLKELSEFSTALAEKPRCFVLTKSDINMESHSEIPSDWFRISSVTGSGVEPLLQHFQESLAGIKDSEVDEEPYYSDY